MAGWKKEKKDADFSDWQREIRSGKTRALYLISGDEPYLIERGIAELEAALIAPGCEELDLSRHQEMPPLDVLLDELRSIPFISEKRLVEVRESKFFSGSGDGESKRKYLEKILSVLGEHACLCLFESKIDRRQKKTLDLVKSGGGLILDISRQPDDILKRWISSRLAAHKMKILESAADSLILRCGGQMLDLDMEIHKICAYGDYSQCKTVDTELVDLLCRDELSGSIFKLCDDISAGHGGKALQVLDRLIRNKEPETLIHFMLARHFRQLLCAKYARSLDELTTILKLPPFVGRRLLRQAERFDTEKLKDLCHMAFLLDMKVKNGEIEARPGIELLLSAAVQT